MSGVTYTDLLTQAGVGITDGALAVRRHPFDTREQARTALVDFHGVLDAIESHVWGLIGPVRLAGITASTRPDPVEFAAMAMVSGLRVLVGPARPHPSMLDLGERPWSRAAACLRAATDLLTVHLGPHGHARSPDAQVLADASQRAGALTRVAALTLALVTVEDTLALRCGQANMPWTRIRTWLPGLDETRTWAHRVTQAGPTHQPDTLDGLGLIGEPIRTTDPVLELSDRLHRLRQGAWQLSEHPDFSVTTLRDLALVGVMVYAHDAALHGADLTSAAPALDAVTGPLLGRAREWRALHTDLGDYRSPGPGDFQVHADTIAVRQLLSTLAPLDGTITAGDHDASRSVALLAAATTVSTDIARFSSRAFDRLARSGQVHIHAATLTGEQIGDDHDLAHAKVTGARIPAPPTRYELTLQRFAAVDQPLTPRPAPAPAPPTPARTADEVLVLTRTTPT